MSELINLTQSLRVCYYGNPLLLRKSVPVTEITPALREFAEKMIESMYRNDGIGLAAPQVGENIRLVTLATSGPLEEISADASPGERLLAARMPLVLINPEIVSSSSVVETEDEGCLSLPGICGPVERSTSVVLKTALLTGETITVECGNLLARCIQHEIDHLDGVLFVDRMSESAYSEVAGELRQLKKATRRQLKKERA
ncbi:MAG: peptide deformylase [Lentisphaeria bacterium]